MANNQIAFGVDIGGTNTKIGLFDRSGKLLGFKTQPTPKSMGPEDFIEQLAQECEELIPAYLNAKLGDPLIAGVGAGAPMANHYTGRVDHAPNLGWKEVPLKKIMEKAFKAPCSIENDANLAALGEHLWGAGKGLQNFVLVTLGTGVGTGLILEGKLHRGSGALGGEGGHMIVPHEKNRLCSCGGLNHLESYLSAKGIKQTIVELTGEEWTVEKLGQLFKEDDLRATGVIHTIADELVKGLVSMAVLLGPEAFVIGGGVSKLGPKFNAVIEAKLDELVHYSLTGKIRVLSASVSAEKGAVHGGAALIFEEIRG